MTIDITAAEVSQFMGLESDVQASNTQLINDLIRRKTDEFKQITSRSAEVVTITDQLFQDGLNCEIEGVNLWLKNELRDIATITEIKEDNTVLIEVADSNDGNDFIIDKRLGRIIRNERIWSILPTGIKISGDFGLINPSDTSKTNPDIKSVIIEMIAVASGLWKTTIFTAQGNLDTTISRISPEVKKQLQRLRLKS